MVSFVARILFTRQCSAFSSYFCDGRTDTTCENNDHLFGLGLVGRKVLFHKQMVPWFIFQLLIEIGIHKTEKFSSFQSCVVPLVPLIIPLVLPFSFSTCVASLASTS